MDTTTGLLFYNARFYDPALGYFLSADTIAPKPGLSQSRNRYSYVLNNPLIHTDPTGHEPCNTQTRQKEDDQSILRAFGFRLDLDDWTLDELEWMIQAINDLLK